MHHKPRFLLVHRGTIVEVLPSTRRISRMLQREAAQLGVPIETVGQHLLVGAHDIDLLVNELQEEGRL